MVEKSQFLSDFAYTINDIPIKGELKKLINGG